MRAYGCKRELEMMQGDRVGYLDQAQCAGCHAMMLVTRPEGRKVVLGELRYMCENCLCKIQGNEKDDSAAHMFTGWKRNDDTYTPCRAWLEDEVKHQEALLELVQGRLKKLKEALK